MTEQIDETRAKYCNNQNCPHRDICLWASEWRPEYPVFLGDEKDCQDFVSKDDDLKTHPKTA